MKLSTNKEQRDFFYKNGWIEFEELLSDEEIEEIIKGIDKVLAERLHTSEENIRSSPFDQLYYQGRDVWRGSPYLQKMVTQVRFAEIGAELMEKKPLRLGYDQVIMAPQYAEIDPQNFSISSLESISCLRGVVCGLMLALEDRSENKEEVLEGIDPFPNKKGNGIYFKSAIPVNWKNLFVHPGQRFYLIVYTSLKTLYVLQPQDPNTHYLKKIGYVFNDQLKDSLHPIIYR